MHPSFCIAVAGAVFAALSSANSFPRPSDFHRYSPRAAATSWQPCEEDLDKQCGRFEVPLDHHNESAGKASLAVARYPATKGPKLGTIFLNPGGPGGSGVDLILGGNSEKVMETVNGRYDLVSWDPRGVGESDLQPACFVSRTEENMFWNGSIARVGIEARGNFTDQTDLDAFYAQVPAVDELLIEFGQRCHKLSPDVLQYVGTAATVRDMVALHDYLEGPDKPIDYWGMSYGTIVGIYFVNMFPDRVGRVVLDGVVDPLNWANKPPYEKWAVNVESTDEALTGFASACAMAGSEGCAFANIGSTTESLLEDIRGLIDLTYEYKKKYGPDADMSSADLREYIYQAMYGPSRWPALATKLQAIRASLKQVMNGSSRRSFELPPWQEITKRQANASNPDESDLPTSTYAIHAITCTDAVDPGDTTTRMVFDEIVRVTREVSPMFGPIWNIAGFVCHKWPVRAVERYTGPWNKKLSNPILVIGNEADPVTPYINAKHVADALGESAVLIEQDDYGHVSLAMKSTCTTAALNNYFLNNQLPWADQFCGTNQILFPGPGITKSTLAALSGSSSMGSSNPSDLETELSKARERVNQLFVAVVALGRKKQKAHWTRWTHVTQNTFESKGHEDQGHIYTTPYDLVKVTKKGGYAPVQT